MNTSFVGIVELFDRPMGWHYVSVPTELIKLIRYLADRGLIAVNAKVGNLSWPTSLLPMGDGTHFVALPAKVRAKEKISLGMKIEIFIETRERKS